MGKSLTRKIIESHYVKGSMVPGEEVFYDFIIIARFPKRKLHKIMRLFQKGIPCLFSLIEDDSRHDFPCLLHSSSAPFLIDLFLSYNKAILLV